MSSSTVILPLERNHYFADADGIISTEKYQDEILQLVLDWSNELATGETISSAAYVDSGITTSGKSTTSTTTTCTVTGVGSTEITVTLSTGRKLQRWVRYYDKQAPSMSSDYR